TLSGLAPYPTQQFDIGRDDNGFFKGQIDDVQIYQRPLTAIEIAEQYRSAAWQTVSLDQPNSNLSTWSQVLPEVEGVYRINSRSTDGFNNISESFPLWEGFVDTLGPRITIRSVLTGDGAAAQTEYTYTVTDYHLDESSIVGPCADPNPTGSPFESRWYRSDFGIVNPADAPITSISGVCQVDGHHPDPVTLEACDLYDNCAIGESTSENNLPTPDDESLIALWVIEEGSGTITADTSGNGNDGVLNGDMVWSSDTPSGSGYTLEFDGVNDYVEIPNESQFDLNVMSVAFWVKVDTFTTNWQAMVTKGDGAWRIHRCGSNQTISFGTSGLSNGDMCSNATFDDGQWHHVVAVYDGSTKSLYVDGALDKSEAVTGSINTNDYPVMIGNNAQKMSRYFDGLIDEVRIYDKALSADEITALALASPLASWSFEEGSGTTAVDVTGNGHDGTLNGQIAWSTDTENGSSYALEFDGVDDYVEIPNESDFDLNVLSVAFWVKVDAFTTNWQGMVTKGDGAWRVHRCGGNQTISFGTSGLSNGDMCSNTTFNDGQWHHVVAVYDGSTKSLYVDGVLDTSLAVTGSVNTNDYPVMIGDNAQRGGRNFGGWIDDVKIYDQALSDSDVAALYNVGSNPLAGTAAGGFPSAGTIALMLLVMVAGGWLAWKRPWRRRYQAG
ncbi:MAG: LamG domain-containing protein, partial [Chloroflexi bacterium]|nr:LamG domain-containing protein [Chloroflexota bacterium]